MQFVLPDSFYATLLLLVISSLEVSLQCSKTCDPAIQHTATDQYALSLTLSDNSTEHSSIRVKVFMNSCPEIDTPGPAWYRLEVLTEKAGGTFEEPPELTEAFTTDNNATIEFSTSEPIAISDLPRTYEWKNQPGYTGSLCFRLIVLTNVSEGDKGCRQIEKCILPLEKPTLGNSGSGSGATNVATDSQGEAPLIGRVVDKEEEPKPLTSKERRCYILHNCTNARRGNFCGNDGLRYTSRCAGRLQKCLLKTRGQSVRNFFIEKCEATEAPTQSTPCWDFGSRHVPGVWSPKCNCKGGYKLVQCDVRDGKIVCWCSTQFGHQTGMEWNLECTAPDQLQVKDCLQVHSSL